MSLARDALRGSTLPYFSRYHLLDALDGVKDSDTLAGGYNFGEVQGLRISVKDVGNINLPLSGEQAQQIISKTCPISLGKPGQTMNDTASHSKCLGT